MYQTNWINVGQSQTDNADKHRVHKMKTNKTKTQHVGHHYMQTNTNNVNETRILLQTTGGKDEPNIVLCENRNWHHNMELTHN